MKNLFLFALIAFNFSTNGCAQVANAMPPDADEFYNKTMPLLKPQLKKIILQTADEIKRRKVNSDSLCNSLYKNPQLKGMSKNDIEGITVLVMVQASKDADDELKNMVMEISRSSNQNNNLAKENDPQNLKLQIIMSRKSDMAEEIGYVMKKISGSKQNIIDNLK